MQQIHHSMMRSAVALIILTAISMSASAQDNVKTVVRPNIPGSFIVDFGFNRALNEPKDFTYGIWGSRTVNVYYQYPIRFGRSKFSFNPGIGLSMERFKFKEHVLFDSVETGAQIEKYGLVKASVLYTAPRKVMFVANYFEAPIEFRFDTRPEDIARSFNVSLGGRIGYIFDSQLKVKYKENAQIKKEKKKEDFGLTQLRYGAYMRFGIGGFNFFGFYNLTPLFQKGKGPAFTEMNTFTVGVSINGF